MSRLVEFPLSLSLFPTAPLYRVNTHSRNSNTAPIFGVEELEGNLKHSFPYRAIDFLMLLWFVFLLLLPVTFWEDFVGFVVACVLLWHVWINRKRGRWRGTAKCVQTFHLRRKKSQTNHRFCRAPLYKHKLYIYRPVPHRENCQFYIFTNFSSLSFFFLGKNHYPHVDLSWALVFAHVA